MPHARRRFLAWVIALGFVPPAPARDPGPVDPAKFDGKVKLACVGDSITQGVGAAKGRSWPSQIGEMLGDRWEVGNLGRSGATLMDSGNLPYRKTPQFRKALEFQPDVVVIMLGTNDTKPGNWKHFATDYLRDYRALVSDFAGLPATPRIFLCLPPYIAKDGNWGINEPNTIAQAPVITGLTEELGLGLVDVHAALKDRDELIPDKVHPNTEGATRIARAVFQALTGKKAPAPAGVE